MTLLLPARPAAAQNTSTLMEPFVAVDYDRGRNVGILDRPRPEYDPLGIRRGAFFIYPRLELGVGTTDNALLDPSDRQADLFGLVAPSLSVRSDWNRHRLALDGGGTFRRYLGQATRNRDEWRLGTSGRLDVGSTGNVTGEARIDQIPEELFNNSGIAAATGLSTYRRVLTGLNGVYQQGRLRGTLAFDHQAFRFQPLQLLNGGNIDQKERDRHVNRGTLQGEYAFSPSTAAYAQLSYAITGYNRSLAGTARDSATVRAIAGVSIDSSGFFRGRVGLGYTRQTFRLPLYRDVGGVSVEASLDYFLSELTTVKLLASRLLQDSAVGSTSAYFDDNVSFRVDHEMRRNLLVDFTARATRQTYFGTRDRDNIWQIGGGVRYLVSSSLAFHGNASYSRRIHSGLSPYFIGETAGMLAVVLQR